MSNQNIVNDIKRLLEKTSKSYVIAQKNENALFELLDDLNIPLDTIDVECALTGDNLQEAITCFVNYGEGSVDNILDAIQNLLTDEKT